MIPTINTALQEFEIVRQPSKNYAMNLEQKTISGYVDEKKAMKQVIYKILNTERYRYLIYSWNYGVELEDLFGEPVSFVCAELERRITEALVQDDRINNVSGFSFEVGRRVVHVTFTVETIFGEIALHKEVAF